jgi:hypothetical protein
MRRKSLIQWQGQAAFSICGPQLQAVQDLGYEWVWIGDLLVPILEDVFEWNTTQIRAFFESQGLALQEWDKISDRFDYDLQNRACIANHSQLTSLGLGLLPKHGAIDRRNRGAAAQHHGEFQFIAQNADHSRDALRTRHP